MLDSLRQFLFGNKRRTLFTAIGVLLISLIGWNTFGKESNAPQYQTAQAEKGTLIITVNASGAISSGSSVGITTSATGVITNVYVQNGDAVIQGQKIADMTLDENSLQKQAAAWANYLNAQASLDGAKAKINSLQSALFKANQAFVTDRGVQNPTDQQKADPVYIEEQANWLQAESDYTNQQGVIAAAQASVTSSFLSYQQLSSTITAPAAGTISGLAISYGSPLTGGNNASASNTTSGGSSASSGQSIGTITLPLDSIQATVALSEIDVTHVQVGQKVTLTLDAFPNKTYTGKVTSIDTTGSVSSGVTTYPTIITLDQTDSPIYPNMAVTAKIITAVKDSVLLVPSTAVVSANGQTTVRILKNGQFQPVSIEVGDANDTETEITSGLSEGDTVVTSITLPPSGGRATSSPFGGTGFGGIRGGGGFGGGGVRRGG